MFKQLRVILIAFMIVLIFYSVEPLQTWREIYLNSIISGVIPEQMTITSIFLIDINLDEIPEIAVKHLDYNGELYGIRHGKLEQIGYINLQDLGLYRNKYRREQWINTYWYKYYSSGTANGITYVDCLDYSLVS